MCSPELTVSPRPGHRKPALVSQGRGREAGGRACCASALGREGGGLCKENISAPGPRWLGLLEGCLASFIAAHWNVAAQSLSHV